MTEPLEDLKSFAQEFARLTRLGEKCSIEEARKLGRDFFLLRQGPLEPVSSIENISIRSKEGHRISGRIFNPLTKPGFTLLFFHRGGWAFGSVEESDPFCRRLANIFGCQLVSIDYRLAPEHPFPHGFNDCFEAALWVKEHIAHLGGDPEKLIISGESAGGNLAAAVTLRIKNEGGPKLLAQILFYPALSAVRAQKGYRHNPDTFFLTNVAIKRFLALYLKDAKDAGNPFVSLDLAEDLNDLPPALIVSGGLDPFYEENKEFAKKLQAAKVPVKHVHIPDVVHGFLDLPIYSEDEKKRWLFEIRRQFTSISGVSQGW